MVTDLFVPLPAKPLMHQGCRKQIESGWADTSSSSRQHCHTSRYNATMAICQTKKLGRTFLLSPKFNRVQDLAWSLVHLLVILPFHTQFLEA